MIEQPSCRQFNPRDFRAIRRLNWDEIIDKDDDDDSWAEPGGPSGGWSRPGNGNDNDEGQCEEDTQGGEKGTGKGKGTMDWKGNGKATADMKGKGKAKEDGMGKGNRTGLGNGKGKEIVNASPEGDDISRVVAVQLPTHMHEADFDTEG
jgi:hypothetical protein